MQILFSMCKEFYEVNVTLHFTVLFRFIRALCHISWVKSDQLEDYIRSYTINNEMGLLTNTNISLE